MLRCHHCGYSERYTPECPKDGAERRLSGRGIQRVEEILDHQFAGYEYARLDRDTAKQKNFVTEVLAAMRERKIQILIGTQMIAKGFDLAGVTLVGVLAIDQTLNSPDFRASEQAWQLLAQVVGRSGRHEPGEVVIQTMSPHHPAIVAAQTHEADAFYAAEADFRRATGYPPFGALARIVLFSRDENKLFSQSERLARDIAPENLKTLFNEIGETGVELLGPALPGLKKADDEYRVHFLIKAKTEALLRAYLLQINSMLERARRQYSELRIVLDIDPRDVG
jgi:primosomal protein N' (replication factor Y)